MVMFALFRASGEMPGLVKRRRNVLAEAKFDR
jgi:hypothetical protein